MINSKAMQGGIILPRPKISVQFSSLCQKETCLRRQALLPYTGYCTINQGRRLFSRGACFPSPIFAILKRKK